MLEFTHPDWLKRRSGKVCDRIGLGGSVKFEKTIHNNVFIRLEKADGSFEILPASKSLSIMILEKRISEEDLLNYEIFELANGDTCISCVSNMTEY